MRNIKQQLVRQRRSDNGATIVGSRFRKLNSRLLILVISTSPFQASVAIHIDSYQAGQDCHVPIEQSRKTAFIKDTQSDAVSFYLRCAF